MYIIYTYTHTYTYIYGLSFGDHLQHFEDWLISIRTYDDVC